MIFIIKDTRDIQNLIFDNSDYDTQITFRILEQSIISPITLRERRVLNEYLVYHKISMSFLIRNLFATIELYFCTTSI